MQQEKQRKQKHIQSQHREKTAAKEQKEHPQKPQKASYWLHLGLLLLLFVPVYASILDEKIDLNGDNIFYHLLGKSLAEGKGFANIYSPLEEPHNHFPPGYPFIISLFMRLGFTDIQFFNVLNGVFAFCTVVLLYFYIRQTTKNSKLAFAVGLLTLLNPAILGYARINMSEVPFMFFSMLALFSLAKGKIAAPYKDPYFLLVVASIVIACYIRTAGIALLLAVVLHYLLSRRWKHAVALFILFVAALLPWQIRTQQLGGSSYMHQFMMINPYRVELGQAGAGDFLSRIADNLGRYLSKEIPNAFLPGQFHELLPKDPAPISYWITGIILTALCIIAIVRLFKTHMALCSYIIFAAGILLLWPSVWTGVRFMLPLIPLLIFLILYTISHTAGQILQKQQLPWNPIVLSGLGILMISPIRLLQEQTLYPYPPQYKAYFDMATWAKDNLPADAVVCCRKTELFYIFGERKSVQYLYSSDPDEVFQGMRDAGVDYVLVDQLGFSSTPRYLVPALKKYASHFTPIYHIRTPDTYLFKLNR